MDKKFNLSFEEFCSLLNAMSQIEVDGTIYLLKFDEFGCDEPRGAHEIGIGLAFRLFQEVQNGGSNEVV